MPYLITPTPAAGQLQFAWLDPTGTLRDLTRESSPNLFVPVGSVGLGSPRNEVESEKLPFAAGNVVRHIRTQPIEIQLPIIIYKTTYASVISQADQLRTWFDTGDEISGHPGYLRITRPDETVRQIECYYRSGLEGNTQEGSPTYVPYVIDLFAPDPTWTDTEAVSESYINTDFGTSLLINNEGDFVSYPIWTITGPASSIVLSNTTQSKTLTLTANGGITLDPGEQLIIDTRPYQQRPSHLQIYDLGNNNLFSHVTATSQFWNFTPGVNRFTVSASGTTAATELQLQYLQRYRGVLR